MYAGTDTGCIRAYKLPLSSEQQEVRCFSGAVTRLRLSHDDSLLYATSADGSLFVFEVKERDPVRSIAKRCTPFCSRQLFCHNPHVIPQQILLGLWLQFSVWCVRDQGEKMPYADEVLLPKLDLDEKKQRILELEGQVSCLFLTWTNLFCPMRSIQRVSASFHCIGVGHQNWPHQIFTGTNGGVLSQVRDVTLQNEYNMRLKDVAMAEQIKELLDKHAAEVEEQAKRYEMLQQEKSERENKLMQEIQQSAQRQQAIFDVNHQIMLICFTHGGDAVVVFSIASPLSCQQTKDGMSGRCGETLCKIRCGAEQAQLAALDDQYQAKVLSEIQRYEELVRDKEALNAHWDDQTKQLVDSHDKLLQEVTDDFTAKLQVVLPHG